MLLKKAKWDNENKRITYLCNRKGLRNALVQLSVQNLEPYFEDFED